MSIFLDKEKYFEVSQNARRKLLTSIYHAKSGHPGGSLSSVDFLAVLSSLIFKKNSEFKFVLSKGHSCPALYALASEFGFIKEEELTSFRKLGSKLQGHPHVAHFEWLNTSTGSLGQGFSVAAGIALGHKSKNEKIRVFSMLGDGELQEGQVWETAMFSSHHNLSNFCAIIDYNKMQSDNLNKNIINLEPLAEKWNSFGWSVIEINGHSFFEIKESIKKFLENHKKPTVIISNTIKGKGVSFMEHPSWHCKVPTDVEYEMAMKELGV